MKVTTARIIVIQEDGQRPVRYTDPRMAAEHWARIKEDEWIEKHQEDPQYQGVRSPWSRRARSSNELFLDGKTRYRKLKRRALAVFRKIMNEDQCSVD